MPACHEHDRHTHGGQETGGAKHRSDYKMSDVNLCVCVCLPEYPWTQKRYAFTRGECTVTVYLQLCILTIVQFSFQLELASDYIPIYCLIYWPCLPLRSQHIHGTFGLNFCLRAQVPNTRKKKKREKYKQNWLCFVTRNGMHSECQICVLVEVCVRL